MAVIYQHRRLDKNEVFYIGIGSTKKRAYTNSNRNSHWKSIDKKTKFEVDILIEGCTWEQACEIERGLILDIGRFDLKLGPLVNQTDGGEGNFKLSPEKNKAKGEKISRSKLGVSNIKLKGIKLTEEHKNNLRISNNGKKYSKEINKKKGRSTEQSGEKNHMYDKMWITNGVLSKTVNRYSEIPQDWKKGRIINIRRIIK